MEDIKRVIGIPNVLFNATSETIEQTVWNRVYSTIESGRGIYLHGRAGRGKSFIVAALLRMKAEQLLAADRAPARIAELLHFADCNDLIMELRSSFKPSTNGDDLSIIENHVNYSMLVLDDIGVNKPTEYIVQAFYTIINSRYRMQNSRITIITSNLSLDELSAKYDDRVVSRIAGMCDALEITGDDRRITK